VIRDATARRLALVALLVALAAFTMGRASATTSDPDPGAFAALTTQVNDLSTRVAELEDNDVSGCLAYSDRHYYRETVGTGSRRWRLPIMLWNMADPLCRPNPAKVWRPKR